MYPHTIGFKNMYTIILAGGFGTRLFPLSRCNLPKQFIPLMGNTSLFQKAIKRALLFSKPEEIYIVTNKDHAFLVENQLKEINTSCNVLLEPCGKNTLPAIMYAAIKIHTNDSEAKVLVLSSDQLVEEGNSYQNAVVAAEYIANEYIVTFGIVPTSPHTGYGYIQKGDILKGGYAVSAFKEKPDLETAETYVKNGYLWNAGIFCFSTKVFLDECRKTAPDVCEAFSHENENIAYELTPKISIDYGLLEKTNRVAVVPMSVMWNDLGSFDALYSVHEKDRDGNAVDGEYLSLDGHNNLISSNKLVSTIGISNIAVIDTPDVLMICPRELSQSVGKITDFLTEKNDERVSLHTTVHRPWGTYTTLMRSDTYLIKRLLVQPHKRLSLQYHNHRSEHWVIVNGEAEITNGERIMIVKEGESTYIPKKCLHRLANETDDVLEVIEVQQGELLTEEDIVRIDDDYNRINEVREV